jgi:Flp pilus assembly protein TadD
MAPCAGCHAAVVTKFLDHGMSRSIGPAEGVTPGRVTNPASKVRYDVSLEPGGPLLTATFPDGGSRRQRLVGRIGAGIFDTSWAAAELDGSTVTGRLFFAPVETLTGRGLALSPFELHAGSPGVDLALTGSCLTCHTRFRPDRLPGAALPAVPPAGLPFPANHLGADAFDHLAPLSCGACHGDADRHADIISGKVPAPEGEIGLRRLGRLAPGAQRDVCARCHLQGDVRIELASGAVRGEVALAAQIPVFVPRRAPPDFRFVGQLERLALSACFKRSPAMTCTTCHQPHSGVAAQGVESFDAACQRCHSPGPGHTAALTPREVTGHAARSPAGCVDCHVRRSAPFDLPHVRSADHFIQRRILPPRLDVPHRPFADPEGELALFDDGRLAPSLATPEGQRWQSGVLAMALMSMLRFAEAARHFEKFPPPGTPAARQGAAPAGFTPLETHPSFHTARGVVLMTRGAEGAARAAFSDALALDPHAADARLARARLALAAGDIATALRDTQALIEAYPKAEQPWDLRVDIARRAGRMDLALAALEASTRRWPSNARAWSQLGALLQQRGDAERAEKALERARALSPALAAPAR